MLITVRYTGPGEAILAGTYIQQDETRTVTPAQLQAAQEAHPAGFEIVAGDAPTPLEPADQVDPVDQTQNLSEPADQGEDLSEPIAPIGGVALNEPAVPVAPRRRRHGGA